MSEDRSTALARLAIIIYHWVLKPVYVKIISFLIKFISRDNTTMNDKVVRCLLYVIGISLFIVGLKVFTSNHMLADVIPGQMHLRQEDPVLPAVTSIDILKFKNDTDRGNFIQDLRKKYGAIQYKGII